MSSSKFFCFFVDCCPNPDKEDCESCLLVVRLAEKYVSENSIPVENGGWETN